jgi:hypothetical protein
MGSLRWVIILVISLTLLEEEEIRSQKTQKDDHMRTSKRVAIRKSRKRAQKKTNCWQLELGLLTPELWESTFLLFKPRVCSTFYNSPSRLIQTRGLEVGGRSFQEPQSCCSGLPKMRKKRTKKEHLSGRRGLGKLNSFCVQGVTLLIHYI